MDIKEKRNLNNIDNYNHIYDLSAGLQYHESYISVVSDYLEYASEHVNIQNNEYYYFIIQRGLLSISHIFHMVFLYTKNIVLTLVHCKKALYYFIEFIGQIGDETHSYLQLNSKDAALFIYKKTIFEINAEHRKCFALTEKEKNFLHILCSMNTICNEIILFILQEKPFEVTKKEIVINYAIQHTKKILNKLFNKKIKFSELDKKMEVLLFVIRVLQNNEIPLERFINICEYFFKKTQKKDITLSKIKMKMYHPKNVLYYLHYSPNKYVNWLFAD